jgi:hypothetical protein
MLRKILMLFTGARKAKVKTNTSANKKHLVIQTVYGAPSVTKKIPEPTTAEPSPPQAPPPVPVKKIPKTFKIEDLILKQKSYLLTNAALNESAVISCRLAKDQKLVGLTKQRALHDGVFMYPESIRYSEEWDDLKQMALEKEAGIAKFELTADTECLQIITPDHGNTVFLVHKDCIERKAWLYRSVTDSSNTAINQ